MRSLRAKLTLVTGAGMAVLLLAAGAAVFALLRGGLLGQLDASLLQQARLVADDVEREGDALEIELSEQALADAGGAAGPAYVQLRTAGGGSLYRSPSLAGRDLPAGRAARGPACQWVRLDGRELRAVELTFRPREEDEADDEDDEKEPLALTACPAPVRVAIERAGGAEASVVRETDDGRTTYEARWRSGEEVIELELGPAGRVLATERMPALPRGEDDEDEGAAPLLTLVLARDAGGLRDTLALALTVLAAVGAATLAASMGVLWLTVRRGLRPVAAMAGRIGRIGPDDLAERLDAAAAPAELAPVAGKLNELLARLERALLRERGFSSDVAHELRGPLAAIRSTIEVALARPREPGDYHEALRDARTPVLRMQAMVDALLSLARLEAGLVTPAAAPVRVDELLRDLWAPLAERARARGLRVRWAGGGDCPLHTDPALLSMALTNVLDNAVSHADEGGEVLIETGPAAGAREAQGASERERASRPASGPPGVRVRVANTGSQVPAGQAPMVFGRFWRGDVARASDGGHAGLGLAVVQRAVAALGGAVTATARPDGWFEVCLNLTDLDASRP